MRPISVVRYHFLDVFTWNADQGRDQEGIREYEAPGYPVKGKPRACNDGDRDSSGILSLLPSRSHDFQRR
jgi:hypothetical protein